MDQMQQLSNLRKETEDQHLQQINLLGQLTVSINNPLILLSAITIFLSALTGYLTLSLNIGIGADINLTPVVVIVVLSLLSLVCFIASNYAQSVAVYKRQQCLNQILTLIEKVDSQLPQTSNQVVDPPTDSQQINQLLDKITKQQVKRDQLYKKGVAISLSSLGVTLLLFTYIIVLLPFLYEVAKMTIES